MVAGTFIDDTSTGYRERVMIACVTFETAMVVEPIHSYRVNKAHLIHWDSGRGTEKDRIYREFYDEVVRRIGGSGDVEVCEHVEKVYEFSDMLRTVLEIIDAESGSGRGPEIFVNISAGSSEYTAAAVIASMMNPGVTPFSVRTKSFTVDTPAEIRKAYYDDGDPPKPIGLTREIKDVDEIPKYSIEMPKRHLVVGLRLLSERLEANRPTSSRYMVHEFKRTGVWFRDTHLPIPDKPVRDQKEAVYYHRDFVTRWKEAGWVEDDELIGKRLRLTAEGRRVIATFHTGRGTC